LGIQAAEEKPIIPEELEGGDKEEKPEGPQDFCITDGQDIPIEEPLEVAGDGGIPADDGKAKSDNDGEKDADHRIRGQVGPPADEGDPDADDKSKQNHRGPDIKAEDKANGNSGEGGMTDGVGKESHSGIDDLYAHDGTHGGQEDQADQGLLHEFCLHGFKG